MGSRYHLPAAILPAILALLLAAPTSAAPPPGAQPHPSERSVDTMPSGMQTMPHPASSPRWQRMSPQERSRVNERAQEFRQMSPRQQQRVREAYRYYQSLPPNQRRALRRQWKHQSQQNPPKPARNADDSSN